MKQILNVFFVFLLFLFLCNQVNAKCLTLQEKVGQMIIVGFDGDSVKSKGFKKVLKQIKNNQISGVIYFSHNIKSKKSLIKMNEKLLSTSSVTPFISIDNEGGQIERHNFFHTKCAKEISTLGENIAKKEYALMAKSLKELGFNLNFAPCVDLEFDKNSIIAKKERSYGTDSDIVSKYASIFIEEHNKNKIITSIKHFPGHGSIDKDTHKSFADSTKTFNIEEIEPYYNLKNYDKLNTVMVSHIFNSEFDEKLPASLSKETIKEFLIDEIGYKGVIVSDDYDMKAIRDNYSLRDIVVNSINAGVNIMIFSNNIDKKDSKIVQEIHKIIQKELELGNINLDDIDNSYLKILNLKRNLN